MTNSVLYLLTVLIWGSTWIAIEQQVATLDPGLSVFYRYLAAAGLMFFWCRLRGLRLRFPGWAHAQFALLGLCLFSLNFVLMYSAQQRVSSAMAAIIFASMLWMNMLNARLFFGTRLELRGILGSVLGMAGIVLLMLPRAGDLDWDAATLTGGALAFAGTLVASLGNMVSQHAQRRSLPVVQANAWGMLYGAGLTLAWLRFSGVEFAFDYSPVYLASLAYLVVFGSIIGFGAYLTLLGRIGAHRAGYVTVTFPVVAVLLAVLIEGYRVEGTAILGIGLALAGNVLVLARRRRTPDAPVCGTAASPGPATG